MIWLRKLIAISVKNFGYKIAAIVLAVLIWGIVQGEEVLEINRRVKVNISVANGFAVKGKPYRFVDATLRGPRVLINELINRPIEAKVFVPSGEVGNLELQIDKSNIKDWDDRIRINLRDSYINAFVDEQMTKKIAIREVLRGAPAEGYFIEKVIITPAKIDITGIKSELSKVEEIVTEPIDITGIKQSKSVESRVMTQDLSADSVSSEIVKVQIQLGDSKVNKRFTNIPIEAVGGEFIAQTKPRYVSIVIQGTPGVLSFVSKDDLKAFVEVENIGPGKYEKEIKVKIPPDTVLIETLPQKGVVEVSSQKKS